MSHDAHDTSDAAARAQREAWRRMGPGGRLALALRMSDDVRAVAIDGEMARDPSRTRAEAEAAVQRRLWGAELFDAVAARKQRGRGGSWAQVQQP